MYDVIEKQEETRRNYETVHTMTYNWVCMHQNGIMPSAHTN